MGRNSDSTPVSERSGESEIEEQRMDISEVSDEALGDAAMELSEVASHVGWTDAEREREYLAIRDHLLDLQSFEESTAPLDERWSDSNLIVGFSVGALIVGEIALLGLEQPNVALMVSVGMLMVALGYESQLLPHFIWEVKQRV